ncbi:AidA/PixA family protein [Pectobacterium parvum]|uniref:AidA/PixA family protein n=1 Tax=Pectobacterium parvum TaxID=2778550 RepID=A0AAP9ILV9_9GAMM|nr:MULTISPECIES: AidA/PixA family protein [Pectobacterium]QHQ25643.1 hypothetical protein GMX10_17550 [Pectobacterium parvum]UVD95777.1 inclusion body family protein [Pectobacterium parvum]GKW40485.1 hypothetical protein PEC301879_03440 [Pectobacterium carotovorum subsp. carotovorum]
MITILDSSHKIINIITIFDTDAICSDSTIKPSTDIEKPTLISNNFAYMVTTSSLVIAGSGTGNLSVKANIDDIIRWSAMSESSNSDSSVLIHQISKKSGVDAFKVPDFNKRKRSAMEPGATKPIPPSFVEQQHWYMQSTVQMKGKEEYYIQFALYNRPTSGDQVLYSYFQMATSVNVIS